MSLSHRKLSHWYHQLARQTEAGLPLPAALRSSRGTGLPAAGLERMARKIEAGATVEGAFEEAAPWLPLSDRLVLSASAEAGRMPQTLTSLSARHAQLGAIKLRLMLACIYPLVMVHAILLLVPVMRMIDWDKGFMWDLSAYLRTLACSILPLWAAIAAVGILMRRQNRMVLRAARLLPFVGGYLRAQGLADFAFALGNFLDAGVLIGRAWAIAGSIATLPELANASAAVQTVIARGERPGLHLSNWSCFPPDFVALYHTGETTGRLEQSLFRIADQYQDSASRALTLATMFYPALLFFAAAAAVIFHVIKFYSGYLKMIEKLAT